MQTAHSTQRFPENTWNRLFKSISDTKKLIKEHGIRNTKSDVAIRAVDQINMQGGMLIGLYCIAVTGSNEIFIVLQFTYHM